MIEQLRKIYPSLIVYSEELHEFNHNYKWFLADNKDIIGIRDEELSIKDISLLTTFLLPYHISFPPSTDEEKKWRKAIYSSSLIDEIDLKLNNPHRLVFFSFDKNQIDPILFKDAIHESSGKKVPILWESANEGIILEEDTHYDECISFEQFIDILMSDLYVKINFFVGPFKRDLGEIVNNYKSLANIAKMTFSHTSKSVLTFVDAIPLLLIKHLDPELRSDITKTIFQEYLNDEEILLMIETFFQCNLNVSETAKVLHMHRNSLQYRLDRFFEKTGVDIRQFHDAITVQLALLGRR